MTASRSSLAVTQDESSAYSGEREPRLAAVTIRGARHQGIDGWGDGLLWTLLKELDRIGV